MVVSWTRHGDVAAVPPLSATSVSDTASMLSHAPRPPGTRRPSVMAGPLGGLFRHPGGRPDAGGGGARNSPAGKAGDGSDGGDAGTRTGAAWTSRSDVAAARTSLYRRGCCSH